MKYLGLDLGKKTLGLAISDRTGLIASFYKSLRYEDEDKLIIEISNIVEKEKIDALVLGLPKNMDNSRGFRAQETLEFKEKLEQKINKKVILQDERLSTRMAENVLIDADLSRKKRKKVIDGVSAVVILQSYLDRKE
ncbi:MAG: Holliday junction resolvase RuvX [Bacilli bacterium]